MNKLKIAIVIGTRPEAIKMAPVYLKMKADSRIEVILIATAQHRQMLDETLAIFAIEPDIDLNIMQANQTLPELSARLIVKVQEALARVKPDVVLVHGDTATCLFAALAANYEKIPVGHVEAGLRTYNFDAPWPEEINRRLTDPICKWCFAPTKRAAQNLIEEKIPESHIHITGNTIVDALLLSREKIDRSKTLINGFDLGTIQNKRMILVTGHRRESFGKPFEQFCLALRDIARSHNDVVIVYPVHLNPNVRKPVNEILKDEERVFLIEPVEYLSFVSLMDHCFFIITDSGGIQEEAPSLHKPVLVTRDTTERPEAIESGLARLVGTSRDNIVNEANRLLTDSAAYSSMANGVNPYGDGKASERIIDVIVSEIGSR
ncbi:MAG: UDP-N-acetylglucosamine 2-epimerase (non-hydrolyzing) [Spirochaetae bacterium HGW-Spirochaetae-1]|jgi:UDP-N-acetylglucosamine 2-epimerase|nr:MAG: UDP-N-acetylglucosamine 2-epimerase (non-hydrolyzing) [Spirochaetae bacterium HGW-Spirochaetae-1]